MNKSNQGETSKIAGVAEVANTIAETNKPFINLNNGDKVEVYVCKARNTGKVLSFALFLMEEMGIKTLGELPKVDLKNPTFLLQLIAKVSEELYEVTAELCSIEHEAILELDLDEVLKLVLQVVNVNKDFFLKNVMPLLPSASQTPQAASKKKQPRRNR